MNRKIFIGAGISVFLILIIVVVLLLREDRSGSEHWREKLDDPFRSGKEGFRSPRDIERLFAEGATPEAQLAAYKSWTRYPSASQPLFKEMKDLTDPWNISNIPMPVLANPSLRTEAAMTQFIERLRAQGKSNEEIGQMIKKEAAGSPTYLFRTNRHTITEGETFTAVLELKSPNGGNLPYTVLSAEMEGDAHTKYAGLGSVQSTPEGDAFKFSWKAPSSDKKYWGSLTMKVRVKAAGIPEDTILHQTVYSSPVVPARFTGQFSESLSDGSLIISAGIDVLQECRFSLQANLFSLENNEPTHWVAVEKILKPGRQTVDFLFYGKIFRDFGHEGKFELRDVRGTCENMPFPAGWLGDPARLKDIENAPAKEEPPLLYIPYTPAKYATRPYRLDEFTDKEWTSPEKERRLRELEEQVGVRK